MFLLLIFDVVRVELYGILSQPEKETFMHNLHWLLFCFHPLNLVFLWFNVGVLLHAQSGT